MMNDAANPKYQLFVDATVDFGPEARARATVLPMQITLSGETLTYASDWTQERADTFYARLGAGELPATSQITPFAYEEAFESAMRRGEDVLYLCFSSGLSDTIAAAHVARESLKEKYPGRRLAIYDTKSATYALGRLFEGALENQDRGLSMDENIAWLDVCRARSACWFTVSDLMYLRHGGRISAAAAIVGTTFRIMPILRIDEMGKLPVVDKVQGRKSAIRVLVRKVKEGIKNPADKTVWVVHSASEGEARLVESMLLQAIPELRRVRVGSLSPVIGAHTGPGTLAVLYDQD